MSEIKSTTSVAEVLGLGAAQTTKEKDKDLGQDTFLKLMVAQIQNQDPMNPTQGAEFLGQLAQFSTVNGINQLQESFSTLASSLQSNQALQASTMVGRSVLIEADRAVLKGAEGVSGTVDLGTAVGDLDIKIYDNAGQLVKTLSLGQQSAGEIQFKWDGLDNGGKQLPLGTYKVVANAVVDGKEKNYPTLFAAKVDSVTLQRNGASPLLNLAGIGSVNLTDIRRVM